MSVFRPGQIVTVTKIVSVSTPPFSGGLGLCPGLTFYVVRDDEARGVVVVRMAHGTEIELPRALVVHVTRLAPP